MTISRCEMQQMRGYDDHDDCCHTLHTNVLSIRGTSRCVVVLILETWQHPSFGKRLSV